MLRISPAGCCARITIDWHVIFWVGIHWNNADWLNVFGEDEFFNLKSFWGWRKNWKLGDIWKTNHFNESVIIVNTSCVVLRMSIEFLDCGEVVVVLPDVSSRNDANLSLISRTHFIRLIWMAYPYAIIILVGCDLQWAAEMTYLDEPIEPPHMWPAGTSERKWIFLIG